MIMPSRFALVPLIVLTLTDNALATDEESTGAYGASLLQNYCARCHSIGATGNSPLKKAPPLREVYLKYPIQQLESGFAEGMGSRHQDMPQIQFSTEEVDAILDYLGNITDSPPSDRPRFHIPDKTVPPKEAANSSAQKSVEHAVEIQTQYVKKAYEAHIAQMTKLGEMYVSLAQNAFKPLAR